MRLAGVLHLAERGMEETMRPPGEERDRVIGPITFLAMQGALEMSLATKNYMEVVHIMIALQESVQIE